MATLTARARKALPRSEFALPGSRQYPIKDKSHARNALARVSAHGSASEKARVRAAVHRKFTTIGRWEGAKTNAFDRPGAREHGRYDWVFSK